MSVESEVAAALGVPVASSAALSGGCVGDVRSLRLAHGTKVVAKSGERLDLEGRMLEALAPHLPVPRVLHASPSLLVMEHVDNDGRAGPQGEAHAADLLAALHDVGADSYGWDEPTLIGGLEQPNPRTESWTAFFAEHRLRYMAHEAHRSGRLPASTLARVERLASRVDRFLTAPNPPGLIHGDAWGGNVLWRSGKVAAFVDPAVYDADPEIELAFTTLFHTFGERFFARYREHRPIAPGFFEERCALYNLWPLLVHVRLFGGGYLSDVERTLKRFGV